MAEHFNSVGVHVTELLSLILKVPVNNIRKALLIDGPSAHRQQIVAVGVLVADRGTVPLLDPLFILVVVLGGGLVAGEVDVVVMSDGSVSRHLVHGPARITPLKVVLLLREHVEP